MSEINTINVGGINYNIQDLSAYREDGNTASQAYSIVGTPINWKGTLYYTSATIAAGDAFVVDTNLVLATNLGKLVSNIKTYVDGDGNLVFRDLTGADTVLPFSSSSEGSPLRFVGSGTISANGGSVNGGAWGESGAWNVFCNAATSGNIVNIQLPLSYVNIERTTLTNATASLSNGKLIIALSGSSTGPQVDSRSARSYTTLTYAYDITVST